SDSQAPETRTHNHPTGSETGTMSLDPGSRRLSETTVHSVRASIDCGTTIERTAGCSWPIASRRPISPPTQLPELQTPPTDRACPESQVSESRPTNRKASDPLHRFDCFRWDAAPPWVAIE